jgi:uncharacterized protein YjbI with pentapeptide repeats
MSDEPQRPVTDDREAWQAYWAAQSMPWRTEPEIAEARQHYLAERRAVKPDLEHGIYPFRDEGGNIRLSRADMEWLLATHVSGRLVGPVEWEEVGQHKRVGVDVRGANLSGEDLSRLPLARLHGGFSDDEFTRLLGANPRLAEAAAVQLERTRLVGAHLEGSSLAYANLQGATLTDTHLEAADLFRAHFEHEHPASLVRTHFNESTVLRTATLANAQHVAPSLLDAYWGGVNLTTLDWDRVGRVGEEYWARERKDSRGVRSEPSRDLRQYQSAVRATRQLATILRAQGLNEVADRFSYRAQVLQRGVLRRQRKVGQWAFSVLLAALSGYGYRLGRILVAYGLIVSVFAAAFLIPGVVSGQAPQPGPRPSMPCKSA